MSSQARFPFSAVVGQAEARLALLLAAVDPGIGGVLLRGDKGAAKSTLARGLAGLLPGGAPFVELPLGATEDRVLGTLDIKAALTGGETQFRPGLLAAAHGGVLYVDDVNLLPDHLVDVLLDVAASGVNLVERDGVSHAHAARFVLVGSMNPEEGELRPLLLDRFGLSVEITAPTDPLQRAEVVRRRLTHDAGGRVGGAEGDIVLRARLAASMPADLPDTVVDFACRLAVSVGAEGLRADLVLCRAAAAFAGWEGRSVATAADVERVASVALGHRSRRRPFDPPTLSTGELERALESARRSFAEAYPAPEPALAEHAAGDVPAESAADAGSADAAAMAAAGTGDSGPQPPGGDDEDEDATTWAGAGAGPSTPGDGPDDRSRDDEGGNGSRPTGDEADVAAESGEAAATDGAREGAESDEAGEVAGFAEATVSGEAAATDGAREGAESDEAGDDAGFAEATVSGEADDAGFAEATVSGEAEDAGESGEAGGSDAAAGVGAPATEPGARGPEPGGPSTATAPEGTWQSMAERAFRAARSPLPVPDPPAPADAPEPTPGAEGGKAPPEPGAAASPGWSPVTGDRPPGGVALADPMQAAPRRPDPDGPLVGVDDPREQARARTVGRTVVMAVDASGAAGTHRRVEAATGAVLGLLADAYLRRDRVAMVTFRGDSAEVVLPPTASVELARVRLAELPTGGVTPLAEGITAGLSLARRAAADGWPPLLVLITDGRATGNQNALERANAVAAEVAGAALDVLVIDADDAPSRAGGAETLATAMSARHLRLDEMSSREVEAAVRDALR